MTLNEAIREGIRQFPVQRFGNFGGLVDSACVVACAARSMDKADRVLPPTTEDLEEEAGRQDGAGKTVAVVHRCCGSYGKRHRSGCEKKPVKA